MKYVLTLSLLILASCSKAVNKESMLFCNVLGFPVQTDQYTFDRNAGYYDLTIDGIDYKVSGVNCVELTKEIVNGQ